MRCRYVKTIFQNKENGYCIFLYETEDTSVPEQVKSKQTGKVIRFTAIGNNLPDTDSIELNMLGNWVKSKFGLQFQVETYEEILPQTIEGITGYLSSGLIKGIGPKTAELIVGRFGTRTFEIFDQYPDNLLQIKGITEKKLNVIMDSYHGSHAVRDLAAYLTPFHVTPNKIQKIYEQFGSESLETVKKQPFMLCQISGFGFLTVDEIAKSSHCRLDDPMRIEGCIHYCMELITQEGHLYQEKEIIQKKVWEQLNHGYSKEVVSEAEISRELYRLVQEGVLYFEDGALYPKKLYHYECDAAKDLAELLVQDTEDMSQLDNLIAEAQRELGILLAAKQAEAVKKAFCHLVSIITGGPGTGKTTVVKALIELFDSLEMECVLVAPTGRAAKRLSETTSREAKTIHRLLEMDYSSDKKMVFRRNESSKLEESVIIIDEASMVDTLLFSALLHAIKPGSRLILIGDSDQLPSVGAGNVLNDIIKSDRFNTVELKEIFRQEGESLIVTNAHSINNGEYPTLTSKNNDFFFLERDDDELIARTVSELCAYRLPKSYGKNIINDIQVITPSRKGAAGTEVLNYKLQSVLNPPSQNKKEKKVRDITFRVGDKVMQIKNNYDLTWVSDEKEGIGVFNGDIGTIIEIDAKNERMDIVFDDNRQVAYDFSLLDELEHAYAITVHKSQGSEYPVVIIPMYNFTPRLMTKNLLYTAVTRAQKMVILVGRARVVQQMVDTNRPTMRYTGLGLLLGSYDEE